MKKDFEEALKLEESLILTETRTSRLVKTLTDDSSFAIISACRTEYSDGENFNRTYSLKKDVRQLGLGFNEFVGRWVEKNPEKGQNEASDENSLLIKGISFKDACMLGHKYEQASIIYKDKDRIVEVCTNDYEDYAGHKHRQGDIVNTFHVDPNKPLNSEDASKIFSRQAEGPASMMKKGSNRKAFQIQQANESFELYEKYLLNTWNGFTQLRINLVD